MGVLIAGGQELATSCEVKLWCDHAGVPGHGLEFKPLRKRKETRHVVLHWTGGPHLAPKFFDNIRARKDRFGKVANLSVHLLVHPDGAVWQFCDLDARCAHAGTVDDSDGDGLEPSANAWSVGIEIVNPATSFPKKPPPPAKSEMAGVERDVVREKIHGREIAQTTFTAAQTAAVLELVRVICEHYGLPVAVPMDGLNVISTVMTEEEFHAFRGVVPHFGLTKGKRDCGLALLRAIAQLGERGKLRPAE